MTIIERETEIAAQTNMQKPIIL